MNKKIILGGAILLIVVLLGWIFWPSQSKVNQINIPTADTVTGSTIGTPITVNGWLRCLSPKTPGNIACVIGVETTTGQDYGLLNLSGIPLDPTQVTTGSHYAAVGTIVATPETLKNYNIQGVIELSQ